MKPLQKIELSIKKHKRNLSKLQGSMVEDASEDFSNIEEHISSFYNQTTAKKKEQESLN